MKEFDHTFDSLVFRKKSIILPISTSLDTPVLPDSKPLDPLNISKSKSASSYKPVRKQKPSPQTKPASNIGSNGHSNANKTMAPRQQADRLPNPHRPKPNLQTSDHRPPLPPTQPTPPQNPLPKQRPSPARLDLQSHLPGPPIRAARPPQYSHAVARPRRNHRIDGRGREPG